MSWSEDGRTFACDVRGCSVTATVSDAYVEQKRSPDGWGWTSTDPAPGEDAKALCMCPACYAMWLDNWMEGDPE